MANKWDSINNLPAGIRPETMLLLTDASVLVHNAYGKDWYRLTPDTHGSYLSGSWSGALNMTNTRQFFASGVLRDGRVFAVGGEVSDAAPVSGFTPLGEIFDPQSNQWTPLNKPASFNWINGDVSACILADGRVLMGDLNSNRTAIWDPRYDDWSEAGLGFGAVINPSKIGKIDEETWVLLQDGSVLTVDISNTIRAEKYVPETDLWIIADQSPATLTQRLTLMSVTDTTVNPNVSVGVSEIGPAMTLPNGKVFFVGGTGHTAIYTPGASSTQPGSWSNGPDLPTDTSSANFNSPNGNIQTAIDAPAVLLPGGKVLLVGGNTIREISNTGSTQFWSNPCNVYVYDPITNATPVALSPQPPSNAVDVWRSRFLLLPNGQVAFTTQQNMLALLTVDTAFLGSPNPAWRPTLINFPGQMVAGHTYSLGGTLFNGLSQANSYGDDAQMSTNFPIVLLTNTATNEVVRARTFNFSTLGIATGPTIVTTSIQIPSDATVGNYNMVVIANAIASPSVSVHIAKQDSFLIIDRSTYSQGEIQSLIHLSGAPAMIDNAVYVVVEGFKPGELGLTGANLSNPPHRPIIASPAAGINFAFSGAVIPQDPSLPDSPQRFTFPFKISFDNGNDPGVFGFGTSTETLPVIASLTAAGASVSAAGTIQLTKNPNPYILHGDSAHGKDWFLSVDIKVFQIKAGQTRFAATVNNNGTARAAATNFIQQAITNLNGSKASAGPLFDAIAPEEAAESLALSPVDVNNVPVYNFALARVRYRDTIPANNVRLFFRMWPAQQTNATFDVNTLYRSASNASGQKIPLLGIIADEIMTIPFFATPRIDTTSSSMNSQTDAPNVQPISPDLIGGESYQYFGCWLDINQPAEKLFPERMIGGLPANRPDGPFTGMGALQSIQQLVRSEHQCLIAEIAFDLDPIPTNADPSISDKLAQRNLAFVNVPNPGLIESRRAPQTFEIRPTPFQLNPILGHDELMIEWGSIPPGSEAEIYLPDASADEIIDLANQMYSTRLLKKTDDHTLRCPTGGVTYIPIPRRLGPNYAGLMTIDLPPTVKKGNIHHIVVKQITSVMIGLEKINVRGRGARIGIASDANTTLVTGAQKIGAGADAGVFSLENSAVQSSVGVGMYNSIHPNAIQWRRVLGEFELTIPISTKHDLLAPEERRLSILRYIQLSISLTSRWYLVFQRYVQQIEGRVRHMGGNPDLVIPTNDGNWQGNSKGDDIGHEHEHEENDHEGKHEDHEHGHEHGEQMVSFHGKIAGLIYDHFGDFAGFALETDDKTLHFESREQAIEALAEHAWEQRLPVTVFAERHDPDNPQMILLGNSSHS